MKELLKKVVVAIAAAAAMGIGTAIGELARDAIKAKYSPPAPKPEPTKRKKRASQ